MKKLINVIAIATLLFTACTKNATTPDNNSSTVVTGSFTITKLTDRNTNEDKTANFSGYTFTFSDNGKITALKNNASSSGTYTKKPAHEGEAAKLIISFNDAPLNELNKSWQIDLISDTSIHLSDDDVSSNEVLEFTAE